jgi:serine/threonine protein kinase
MDERCKSAHAKLLSGTCPWCGRPIISGQVDGELEPQPTSSSQIVDFERFKIASLAQLVLDIGPLEFRIAARYIAEVAGELAVFHRVKRLHGAISPAAIIINEARSAELGNVNCGENSVTRTDRATESLADPSGIADYLAPEQALGYADSQADIYSLGCTLYFLLTGRAPFPDGSISERLLKQQQCVPEPIRQLRPDVPVELAQVCEKMMAKKPAERYQTVAEVAEALSAWGAPDDSTGSL